MKKELKTKLPCFVGPKRLHDYDVHLKLGGEQKLLFCVTPPPEAKTAGCWSWHLSTLVKSQNSSAPPDSLLLDGGQQWMVINMRAAIAEALTLI